MFWAAMCPSSGELLYQCDAWFMSLCVDDSLVRRLTFTSVECVPSVAVFCAESIEYVPSVAVFCAESIECVPSVTAFCAESIEYVPNVTVFVLNLLNVFLM